MGRIHLVAMPPGGAPVTILLCASDLGNLIDSDLLQSRNIGIALCCSLGEAFVTTVHNFELNLTRGVRFAGCPQILNWQTCRNCAQESS